MAISGAGGWIPSITMVIKDNTLMFLGTAQNAPRNIVYSHHWTAEKKIAYDLMTPKEQEQHQDSYYAGSLYAGYLLMLMDETVRIDFRAPHIWDLKELHANNNIEVGTLRAMHKAGIEPALLIAIWEKKHASSNL